MTIKAKVELITPARAAWLLQYNAHNQRPVNSRQVDLYARQMAADKWPVTGEGLIFDDKGKLINGQHRLRACVQADVPFESLVVHGIDDPLAMQVIDTPKVRTARDVGAIARGEKVPLELIGAGRLQWRAERGAWSNYTRPSHSEIFATLDEHPGISEARSAPDVYDFGRLLGSPTAALWTAYRMRIEDLDAASAFIEAVAVGADLSVGDPALALRNRAVSIPRGRGVNSTQRLYTIAGLIGKAWRLTCEGREVKLLRVKSTVVPTTYFPI